MIAFEDDRQPNDPTQAEIQEACEVFQRNWSRKEKRARRESIHFTPKSRRCGVIDMALVMLVETGRDESFLRLP
jgi:hypothetical protein